MLKCTVNDSNHWNYVSVTIPEEVLGNFGNVILRTESQSYSENCVWGNPILMEQNINRNKNVILYIVDALRPDRMSGYGYSHSTSPNLDRFASESIVFTNAIAPATGTLPSITSLYTNVSPLVRGQIALPFLVPVSDSLTTFPELLRNAGYETITITDNPNTLADTSLHASYSTIIESYKIGDRKIVHERLVAILEQLKEKPFFIYIHTIETHATDDNGEGFQMLTYSPSEPF